MPRGPPSGGSKRHDGGGGDTRGASPASPFDLAILFGSLAEGRARPDSDLDLAVQAASPLVVDEMMALIGDLAEALGRPVDLADLARVGEPLLGQVLKGQRVLGSDSAHARLITRHLIDAADFLPLRERILRERRQAWIGR